MKITIETIPHNQQRYETCGDWQIIGDDLIVKVSDLDNWRYECCLMVHELVEALLCHTDGVTTNQVDDFDMEYERKRSKSITLDTTEPGDHPDAPYRVQHFIATTVERIVAMALGVKWTEYETAINSL